MNENLNNSSSTESNKSPYGNYKTLFSIGGQPLFALGPHYYVFVTSVSIISLILLFMFYKSQKAFGPAWKIIVFGVILFFILSYIAVGISNPGLVRKNIKDDMNEVQNTQPNQNYCRFCNINKEKYTKHCYDCDICIQGYDHHCVWVGKCIGENNLCRFYTFICSLSSAFIIFFVAVLNSTGF